MEELIFRVANERHVLRENQASRTKGWMGMFGFGVL
jgi:hypothetical protein